MIQLKLLNDDDDTHSKMMMIHIVNDDVQEKSSYLLIRWFFLDILNVRVFQKLNSGLKEKLHFEKKLSYGTLLQPQKIGTTFTPVDPTYHYLWK